jgi:(1->4)-alpha-D-glucan 1-alpha-D-glucosylmutase
VTPVRATYRIQFNRDFTFAHAEGIVPYLADLGISHLYASPITTARPGSTHGYDVVDPTRVNPELGGEEGLRSLVAALHAHGLGLIIDIVPNHMGVADGHNPWWQHVLEHGQASRYARFFDIDWARPVLLPFLGAPLAETIAAGDLKLAERDGRILALAYGSSPYPIRPEDQDEVRRAGLSSYTGDRLAALLDRQHYRLAWWRTANDELNWRRFFTITELASLRVEDDAVFEAVHALPLRLYAEGLIDGLRIDHVDGLTDPTGYCRKLKERMEVFKKTAHAELVEALPFSSGAEEGQGFDKLSLSGSDSDRPYIVLEKILAHDEPLNPEWPVEGTTGYDFMEEVSALLHSPRGDAPLTRLWTQLTGRPADFHTEELQARRDMLSWEFEGQLHACVRAFAALAVSAPETSAYTAGMIRRAIQALLWAFPVYRTYGTGRDAPALDEAIREKARERARALAAPGESMVIDAVLDWLAGRGPGDDVLAADAVRRFQQLSAPIAAKAVEDTAFYRYGRLLSRNDVGFDPARLAMAVEEFHARMAERARRWPRAMLATATHDHKRGEDVRARLAVLSEVPDEWSAFARAWLPADSSAAPDDAYMLLQTLIGAWPMGADGEERVAAWQQKALREAKLRSSWAEPDPSYEGAARAALQRLLADAAFTEALTAFVRRITPAAEANGLVQTFLRNTLPGIPDLYQGTESADFSLVDPDNRRPVDYARRRAILAGGGADYDARKQRLIAALLRLRRDHPALFVGGSYEPVTVTGARDRHLIAFIRRGGERALFAAATIRSAAPLLGGDGPVPPASWWGDTRLVLPDDLLAWEMSDPLAQTTAAAPSAFGADAAALMAEAPVMLRLFTRR